ncbi:V-type ATP synthase subunit F [Peptacetobacter hominis]|uniref:V-type ATP synthase subunit F n=1 Tax=Peptacetobacter hominis TaxID=2743610 RepID=A0A544QU66_9FIRM|nr:V-type ATP synthase subunit F [Peptacetobacter hominis]TQQ84214.1 V-type ATP synthase subunit F [Peptacetobacter hominis]
MYKIGVIGDRDSVIGFKAVGLDTFPCSGAAEAKKVLEELVAEESYAIIYITEGLCKDMTEEIDSYKSLITPAIIPIPGIEGSLGIGIAGVKKNVEKAVGADILFGDN